MPLRAIVATSTGGLDELQIPHRIRILRLQLRIQGRRLLYGLEVKGSAFHDWMLRTPGQVAETAPPSQIEIANFFRDLIREGYEEVLVLTLSSRMSRTYEQLDLLRNAYAHKLMIHLFDTGMAAHAEALMALEADRLLEQGASMADIVAHLTDLRARTMTFLTVVFVLGPYCADQGGVVFLLTESSMLYHHLLNPLCAFVSFVLLEREPKLPARCVPLALVPTMLYGSVALWANYQRLITGPYPFLLVYQQTTRQTVLWCAAILAMNLLYAWLVWRLGGNCRKKRNVGLLFRS